MKWDISFNAKVEQFPGKGGWVYVPVPKNLTKKLQKQGRAWGMYPITVNVGDTTWNTKLMLKKGGVYFIALKAIVRKNEGVDAGSPIQVNFRVL